MFRITTLSKPCHQTSAKELSKQMAPLLDEGIDLLCCQSVARQSTPQNSGINHQGDETNLLAKHLQLTCSCFAPHRQQQEAAVSGSHPLRGVAIFTGPGIWMLNSGSFVIGEKDCKEVVLFALVRKNGTSVLIFNFHLADSPADQRVQLADLFRQSLLKEIYGAVVLCTDGKILLSSKQWAGITADSSYTPFQFDANGDGQLSLLAARNGSVTTHPADSVQDAQYSTLPGVSLSVDIKQPSRSKRSSRPTFPLSFREQWLGYRDNRVFA